MSFFRNCKLIFFHWMPSFLFRGARDNLMIEIGRDLIKSEGRRSEGRSSIFLEQLKYFLKNCKPNVYADNSNLLYAAAVTNNNELIEILREKYVTQRELLTNYAFLTENLLLKICDTRNNNILSILKYIVNPQCNYLLTIIADTLYDKANSENKKYLSNNNLISLEKRDIESFKDIVPDLEVKNLRDLDASGLKKLLTAACNNNRSDLIEILRNVYTHKIFYHYSIEQHGSELFNEYAGEIRQFLYKNNLLLDREKLIMAFQNNDVKIVEELKIQNNFKYEFLSKDLLKNLLKIAFDNDSIQLIYILKDYYTYYFYSFLNSDTTAYLNFKKDLQEHLQKLFDGRVPQILDYLCENKDLLDGLSLDEKILKDLLRKACNNKSDKMMSILKHMYQNKFNGVFYRQAGVNKLKEHANELSDENSGFRGFLSRIDLIEKPISFEVSQNIEELKKAVAVSDKKRVDELYTIIPVEKLKDVLISLCEIAMSKGNCDILKEAYDKCYPTWVRIRIGKSNGELQMEKDKKSCLELQNTKSQSEPPKYDCEPSAPPLEYEDSGIACSPSAPPFNSKGSGAACSPSAPSFSMYN